MVENVEGFGFVVVGLQTQLRQIKYTIKTYFIKMDIKTKE
jgi:hypothetical protein